MMFLWRLWRPQRTFKGQYISSEGRESASRGRERANIEIRLLLKILRVPAGTMRLLWTFSVLLEAMIGVSEPKRVRVKSCKSICKGHESACKGL